MFTSVALHPSTHVPNVFTMILDPHFVIKLIAPEFPTNLSIFPTGCNAVTPACLIKSRLVFSQKDFNYFLRRIKDSNNPLLYSKILTRLCLIVKFDLITFRIYYNRYDRMTNTNNMFSS